MWLDLSQVTQHIKSKNENLKRKNLHESSRKISRMYVLRLVKSESNQLSNPDIKNGIVAKPCMRNEGKERKKYILRIALPFREETTLVLQRRVRARVPINSHVSIHIGMGSSLLIMS